MSFKIVKRTLSQVFNEKTKISEFPVGKELKDWPDTWKIVYYKGYPRFPAISLPKPYIDTKHSLRSMITRRKSVHDFLSKPISKDDLSTLLYYSAGLRKYEVGGNSKRFYPSAGGRFPLEVYPVVLNVEGIKEGIYHYYLKSHMLECILGSPFKKALFDNFGQSFVKRSAVLFAITAVFNRTQIKYGDRGYRHILTEVGHMTQNLYLVSTALGLGCCSIGGYKDDGINSLIDLDGVDESVVGITSVGFSK